jgi:hypothetical protein
MKKIWLLLAAQLFLLIVTAQQTRFNKDLDKFCKSSLAEVKGISTERKLELESIARQLVKKKYVLFTCQTNSRRTVLLQVWAQTAFYYYGLFDKLSFSIGDTVTGIYPGVMGVLSRSGFYCMPGGNSEHTGYMVAVNKQYPQNLLLSKKELGTIDTDKGVVVNICESSEQSHIAAANIHSNLPYQSPVKYESTLQEKARYMALNRQIAREMLYLASKLLEYSAGTNSEG